MIDPTPSTPWGRALELRGHEQRRCRRPRHHLPHHGHRARAGCRGSGLGGWPRSSAAIAVERMLKRVVATKGRVLLCGTFMDALGLSDREIMEGARRSTMDELAAATVEADKVLVFRNAAHLS